MPTEREFAMPTVSMNNSHRTGRGGARWGGGGRSGGSGPVAAADIVIDTCTIVDTPTPATHTVCPDADLSGEPLTTRW